MQESIHCLNKHVFPDHINEKMSALWSEAIKMIKSAVCSKRANLQITSLILFYLTAEATITTSNEATSSNGRWATILCKDCSQYAPGCKYKCAYCHSTDQVHYFLKANIKVHLSKIAESRENTGLLSPIGFAVEIYTVERNSVGWWTIGALVIIMGILHASLYSIEISRPGKPSCLNQYH